MCRITFKRSILASAVLFCTKTANAALYQVMEVTPSTGQSYGSAWGVAIQASTGTDSCFNNSTVGSVNCQNFALAGETRIEKPAQVKQSMV